jgi:hypothetical protein
MNDDLLSTQVAASVLQEAIPEPEGYWSRFLVNNKRPDRNPPFRVEFVKMGGGVLYPRRALADFVEWEKSRRLGAMKLTGRAAEVMRAFGIGEAGGGTTGRRLDISIHPQQNPSTGEPYLQLIVKDPLLVFHLEIEQAEAIIRELRDAVNSCKGKSQ